ncbi:hypothetical protein L6R53_06565 [Myxococcota bacterium]|nr:hypothetical protein [Myxococcota bacterium]
MLVLLLSVLLACDSQAPTATPEGAAPAADPAAATGPAGLPPGHPPIDGSAGAAPAPADPAAAAPHGADASAAPVEAVPKAEGADARTVSEVFAQKAELAGKPVAVRGKVVKFNPNIMGANWVHLQDGSGSSTGGDHDLTLQIKDTVAVGDVVTIRGTVVTDKDFGAGYAYDVIVQDGAVVP